MGVRENSFRKALIRLEEVLQQPETDITRDAAIQRFEFCCELAWKAIQEFLRSEGGNCVSPKGCLREAFKQSLIEDEGAWLSIMEDRNLTSHTYDEKLAHAVYGRLPSHLSAFYELAKTLETR